MFDKSGKTFVDVTSGLQNLKIARSAVIALLVAGPVIVVTFLLGLSEILFEPRQLRLILPLVYMIPVIFSATQLGVAPALVTALLCALAADFFFYEPLYSLRISDPQQVFDLVLFLGVASVLGHVAGQLRERLDGYLRQQTLTEQLYSFSQRLLSCSSVDELRLAIEDLFAGQVRRQVNLIDLQIVSGSSDALPSSVARHIQRGDKSRPAGRVEWIEDHAGGLWAVSTLIPGDQKLGTVVLRLQKDAGANTHEIKDIVQRLLLDVTTMLTRLNVARAISTHRLRFEANYLKDILVSSISHEIGSPLAAIVGSADTLSNLPEIQRDSRASVLVDVLCNEGKRLKQYADRISRATRIHADRLTVHATYVELNDLVNNVVSQRKARLADYDIKLRLSNDLPLVFADEILTDLAIGELIENATKYSPSGSTIEVTTFLEDGFVGLSVNDEGMGLSSAELKRVFNSPFRSSRHSPDSFGLGIGLWIANSFVSSSGGTMTAKSDGAGKGAKFEIRFPIEPPAARLAG